MQPHERAWLSLEGLSVGDTFGERFFGDPDDAMRRIAERRLSPAPWPYTDDTEMAFSVFEVLQELGAINQDTLASRFATRMQSGRGYSQGTYAILGGIREGRDWRALTRAVFRGMGSFGNGAAMRVAPLGAYFADATLELVAEQARLSAEVTHAHPEGIAGAVAVAVATALAWRSRHRSGPLGRDWIVSVRDAVPRGYTRDAIDEALGVPDSSELFEAAKTLGNGSGVTAPDTVPLCLWVAARRSDSFEEALWEMVSALGDRDTTCAIVGGIVAVKTGRDAIPSPWLKAREEIPVKLRSRGRRRPRLAENPQRDTRHHFMSERSIGTAKVSEAERCFAVLTLAFAGDPAARWAWPDRQQYLDAFPRFARVFGGGAVDAGTAHYVEGFCGVALWLPPGTSPDEASLVRVIEDTVAVGLKEAMFSMFEQMDAYHPHEQHWHLPLIGVDPVSQGRGYGSALLSRALDECDRQRVLAYLEATSPRNVPLYKRHGFEVLGTIQVGTSPPIFPMLRKPR